jgi:hypothetical protein
MIWTFAARAAETADQSWWSEHSTLVVGVVGILVSGVVGPSVAAWFTARRERAKDERAYRVAQRDDLRAVVDESAKALVTAASQVRQARKAQAEGKEMPREVKESLASLAVFRQRLLLRVDDDDGVIRAFERARTCVGKLAAARTQPEFEEIADQLDAARTEYLAAARRTLRASIAKE